MADETVKHAGWMPGNPSMDVGGDLMPGGYDVEGGAAGTEVVSRAGDFPKGATTSMTDSGGTVSTRIMENDISYDYPSSGQGNLEPTGNGSVKGT